MGSDDIEDAGEVARLVCGPDLERDVATVRYQAMLHYSHEQQGLNIAAAEGDDDGAGRSGKHVRVLNQCGAGDAAGRLNYDFVARHHEEYGLANGFFGHG